VDVLRLTTLLPELPAGRTHLLDNLGRVRREVGPITPELSDAVAGWERYLRLAPDDEHAEDTVHVRAAAEAAAKLRDALKELGDV